MRTFPFLCFLTLGSATALVGCGEDEAPSNATDAGTDTIDSGRVTDTGTPTGDTGTPNGDTAAPSGDTAAPPNDAPSEDASSGDTAMILVVNGCEEADYIDATTSAGLRKLDPWTGGSGKKCFTILRGQSFTWLPSGGFMLHPLDAKGGTTPTPITTVNMGSSKTIDFPNEGTFGYVCKAHSNMTGAIRVLP